MGLVPIMGANSRSKPSNVAVRLKGMGPVGTDRPHLRLLAKRVVVALRIYMTGAGSLSAAAVGTYW